MPRLPIATVISLALIVPASPNYALRQLDFGAGGGTGQSSGFNFEGVVGENGAPMSGTAYNGGLGFGFTQMANVPDAPTITNPQNYYNKLHLVIDPGSSPPDTLFAIAISSDDFATTQYIKPDHGLSQTLTFADYQTFAAWGGSAGFDILGLEPSTMYSVKVKAYDGAFTESPFGPSASASTVNPSLTFDIDVAPTDSLSSPPYLLNLGTLLAGTVATGANRVWVSLGTNSESGAGVYIAGQNGGLSSQTADYTINSTAGDLESLSEGFGLRVDTLDQASGGPLAAVAPYDVSGEMVGNIKTTYQMMFTSTGPIAGGRASAILKAKVSSQVPAQTDYQEILTIVSASHF